MKIARILVTVVLLFHSGLALAQEPITLVWDDGTVIPEELRQAYIYGAITGIGVVDAKITLEGNEYIYCVTANHGLTVEEFWNLADQALAGPVTLDLVVLAGVNELRKKYPCPKQH